MILAGVCITVAASFLLRRDFDKAFVIAAAGLVAWFLNYRAQVKEIIEAANLQDNGSEDDKESYEDSNDE